MTITLEQALRAVPKSKGNHSKVAKKLKCSRSNITALKDKFPEFAEALHEAKETRLDEYEDYLDIEAAGGNIAAIIFMLKTQGRGRGYSEQHDVKVIGLEPLAEALAMDVDKVYGSSK